MTPRLAVLFIGVLLLCAAAVHSVGFSGELQLQLSDQVYREILFFERHYVGVVRFDDVEIHAPGSRSQSVLIKASVISNAVGDAPAPLTITGYIKDTSAYEAGKHYLVALYDTPQWRPAWALAGYVVLQPDADFAAAASQAAARFREIAPGG